MVTCDKKSEWCDNKVGERSDFKIILCINNNCSKSTMLCTSPQPASPAGSEISVGNEESSCKSEKDAIHGIGEDYFRPLKRLKMIGQDREIETTRESPPPPPVPSHPPQRSSVDGVKSFSIVDILGRESPNNSPKQIFPNPSSMHLPSFANVHSFDLHNANHHASSKIVRPWDHLRGPVPVRPFLPPALLHYEHRLALDYQRQIQEHLTAQAQLLRHMSMEIIPSESGSERSSSAASDCCSPEILSRSSVDNNSNHHHHHNHHHHNHQSSQNSGSQNKTKQQPNGTPLDALFQMTSKTFDEQQSENGSGNSHFQDARL